jgi:hypothetical protein
LNIKHYFISAKPNKIIVDLNSMPGREHIVHLVFLGLLLMHSVVAAQPATWPDGIYLEHEQFLKRTPDLTSSLDLVEIQFRKLLEKGCSPYVFKSNGDGISNYRLSVRPRVVVHNGEVYVNTLKMELGEGYSKCLTKGSFLVFPANITNSDAVSVGGAAMLLLTGVGPGRTATLQFALFVLSLRTGNHRLFTKDYLRERLSENKELFDEFMIEQNVNDSILIHYMDAFNRSLEASMSDN